MKLSKEAIKITLSLLESPELHYKSCFEDISGRPCELTCNCPLLTIMEKIRLAREQ